VYEGIPVVDVHIHAARTTTLKVPKDQWALGLRDPSTFDALYDPSGAVRPDRFDALLAADGVDVGLLMCEYSPKVTGIQPIEDNLPLVAHNPDRFRVFAAINPHYHYPVDEELSRQLDLGAIALKIHPVHAGCFPHDRALFPAYDICRQRGLPVVIHCGTSVFPGAVNSYADPVHIDELTQHFPTVQWVLAHGGRGWWYDAAAFLAQARDNVWLELSGLPPKKLPEYYARHDLERLFRKAIFGSDWPGVPGFRHNIEGIAGVGLSDPTLERVLWRNADEVFRLGLQEGG
jgi:predicted TIM-barrel fold metal-dependent hydrolase